MTHKPNPRQLVLRRDTATGLTHVGWETDLPLVRFEHLELIGEPVKSILPDSDSEYYAAYQAALRYARQANHRMLEQQMRDNQSKGWYRVPFALARDSQGMQADSVGNYAAAAMQLQYELTYNCKLAWAILRCGVVEHVRTRYPKKELDELTYQVWYHKQLHDLQQLGGILLEGTLMVCESGLWFEAK
jgi:hypothetical protein